MNIDTLNAYCGTEIPSQCHVWLRVGRSKQLTLHSSSRRGPAYFALSLPIANNVVQCGRGCPELKAWSNAVPLPGRLRGGWSEKYQLWLPMPSFWLVPGVEDMPMQGPALKCGRLGTRLYCRTVSRAKSWTLAYSRSLTSCCCQSACLLRLSWLH